MDRGRFPVLVNRAYVLRNNLDCHLPHLGHGLPDGGKCGRQKSRVGHIIKADHGTLLRHFNSCVVQRTDCAEGGHVIEGH